MSIEQFLYQKGRTEKRDAWQGTFNQYFEMVLRKPILAQTAVQRLYHMILSHGTKTREDGTIEYLFFKNHIFGLEKQIEDIMLYLKSASMGLDIKKRVLLLLGPPGGGKSRILSLLKKGLAEYTQTEKGAVYAIKDCPIHEEPLHLIPNSERDEIRKLNKINIEGKLCPVCQYRFETEWNRNLNHVPIERIFISEENRVGIGTFAPAEKNDMEELYGSADLSKLEYYGNEGDVRAYAFNGELHSANRGIMEFIEVLKAKPDFLHVLLTLAEEQLFKTPRFPLQFVDECLIAHTNEGEFYRFVKEKENEAIVDRLFIVRMPYNMESQNEEKIYREALKKTANIHPGAFRLASDFAIGTREHEDPLRRGMSGISPRFILNALAVCIVKQGEEKKISPENILKTLSDHIFHYPVLDPNQREAYLTQLKQLIKKLPEYEALGSNEETLDQIIGES